MKRFLFPVIMLAILVADAIQVIVSLSSHEQPQAYSLGLILFSGMCLVGWVWHDIWNYTPKPAIRTDNGNPDLPATRQWVESKVNAATAGCLTVGGPTFSKVDSRICQLETVVNAMCRDQESKSNEMITASIQQAVRYFLSHEKNVKSDGPANNPGINYGEFEGQDGTIYVWHRLSGGDIHVQAIFGGEVMFSFFV